MRIVYSSVLVFSIGIIVVLVSAVMIAGASPVEVKGDLNCDASVNPVDSLLLLRHDAGLSVNLPAGCDAIGSVGVAARGSSAVNSKGDMNCDGSVNPVDSLLLLRHDAGLNVNLPGGCDAIGSNVSSPTPAQTLPPKPSFTAVPTATQPSVPTPTPTPTAAAATQTPTSPPVTPTPTPQPTSQTFGDGTWLVGFDIQPGIWRNSDSSGFCYWARLSGLGGELGDIISNGISTAIQTVEIKPGDVAFEASNCGTWTKIG
ncbi:MAG: hypothetical protein IIC86_08700 [Chloroflexi bacterium]|nr:hypothetical protein [Chloroflexota bacterium]